MLQQSAYETVMHCLGCRRVAEFLCEICIVNKQILQQLVQIGVLNASDQSLYFIVHSVDAFGAHRQIIGWIIFSFMADTDTLHADLKLPLEICHITVYLYVIQIIIITDARIVRLPYLGVDSSGLIL